MNSFEFLQAMTDIPNDLILAAGACLPCTQERTATRRLSARRIALIAAIVALIVLLVGCAVVYALNLQSLKVGEHHFYVSPAYDDSGEIIPPETRAPNTQISLQGVNLEALTEWVAFTNSYDPDLSIAIEADRTGSSWETIAENYHITYGCYSQEMVDKLDALIEKYDLKLLSTYTTCQYYESGALLGALGLEGLLLDEAPADADYSGGYFFPEGTFDLSMTVQPEAESWQARAVSIGYRYSLKEFFDPVTGTIPAEIPYTQWNYKTENGQTVLLVLGENLARIYADLPDAFVSIHADPWLWTDQETAGLTAAMLEQLAELFDFTIHPRQADMVTFETLRAQAQADHDARLQASADAYDAMLLEGYDAFARYCLERSISPETQFYALYDVNGDGTQELIVNEEILSMAEGNSYRYFSLRSTGIQIPQFQPCRNNIFEVYTGYSMIREQCYYYYEAGPKDSLFLTGLIHDTAEDIWYQTPNAGVTREKITAERAQEIRDSYEYADFDWLPLKKYGMDVISIHCKDPYARYIASKLERYDNASDYGYALMDLNGDGIEELIARDTEVTTRGETYLLFSIHSIKDGQLWDMDADYHFFSHICEGGILEYTENFMNDIDPRAYHHFYRCTENGIESIEELGYGYVTGYWDHTKGDQVHKVITQDEVMAILDSYKRLELELKPFTAYPLQ